MLNESVRNIKAAAQDTTTTKKPRKQATKPTAAAPAVPVAVATMTTAERAEMLSKLSPDDLALVAKLEAGEPAPEPMPTETTDPFDSDHLTFTEPETYLQPVGTLARYALAHMLMGEFGERLFGNDYLDSDGFEKLHGLYIDIRAGIAHGFPHMNLEDVKPSVLACESKFFL